MNITQIEKIDLQAIRNMVPQGFWTDGRFCFPGVIAALEAKGFSLIPFKSSFLVGRDNKTYKVRTLTDKEVNFLPSKSKGFGRQQREGDLEEVINEADGFLVVDVDTLGEVPVYQLSARDAVFWTKTGTVTRNRFLKAVPK